MKAKANPNILNTYEQRPLDLAVFREHLPAIEALIDGGSDVNKANEYGFSALHFAVTPLYYTKNFSAIKYERVSYQEVITMLIQKGAKVDQCDKSGWTPLMQAVVDNQVDSIHALLSHGANINSINSAKQTVLHLAVQKGNLEALKALMQYQELDLNAQDKNGRTALHLATSKASSTLLQELLKHKNLKPNIQDNEGSTALHWAHQRWVVEQQDYAQENLTILSSIADPSICDNRGKKAEDYKSATENYTPQMTLIEKVKRRIYGDEAYKAMLK